MTDTNIKQDVYEYIVTEETNYQQNDIQVVDGYDWSMYQHIRLTLLYKASKYSEAGPDRPFKNILRPILNLQYRAEGFDVKDIVLYVNEAKNYFKSFLVKKFHNKWARDNGIDTFIDRIVESYVDFGGALIKNVKGKTPENVFLPSLAFCDQTDILSGPICEKHYYTPDQLKEMKGWDNVDELIALSENEKEDTSARKENRTPGKYIEVYELHGILPDWWLHEGEDGSDDEENKFTNQLHIVAFYRDEKRKRQGISLFKGKETKERYKFVARDEFFGRALGMGGAEELFEPQVWINYDIIRMKDMLDAASKVVLQTTDKSFAKRQNLRNIDNLEVLHLEDGKEIKQINTTPVNIKLFEQAMMDWEDNAKMIGAATESIMGEQPSSGTPFALQELVTAESHSLHEYRKGKLATFLSEVYRDWIIPSVVNEVNQGQEFLEEVDMDELQIIADSVMTNESNKIVKEKILSGELITKEEIELNKNSIRETFMKGGNKKFIKILEKEMEKAPIDVFVNIVGKQKYLAQITDKLVNVFRTIIANPGIFQQNPSLVKIFNEVLEASGLSPIDFSGVTDPQAPVVGPGQGPGNTASSKPLGELPKAIAT